MLYIGTAVSGWLFQRSNFPAKGQWALPGGFVDLTQDADLLASAKRKLIEKTGIKNLDNEKTEIEKNGQKIIIAGVEDLWFGNPDAEKVLDDADKKDFVVVGRRFL